jgi:hypothetical protein
MDWIEQIFGVSPDGGDGSTEALIVFACSTIVLMIVLWRVPRLRTHIAKAWASRR